MRFPATGKRHCCIVGPKGGGKTSAKMHSVLWHVSRTKSGATGMILAKRQGQLTHNLANELRQAAADLGIEGVEIKSNAWTIPSFFGEPNVMVPVVFGEAGQESVVSTITSYNLSFAVVDEAVNMNTAVRRELISRLRVGRLPLCWWSMNPAHPAHAFKLDMIDNPKANSLHINVPISENPSLPADYIEQLEATYPLQWQRDRFIHGLWAPPGGLVYGIAFADVNEGGIYTDQRTDDPVKLRVGVDWATKTVSHAVLVGIYADGTFQVLDEWRHDGSAGDEMSEPAQAASILDAFARYGHIEMITVDKSSKGLRLALDQQSGPDTLVKESSWTVRDRIGKVSALIGSKRITAARECTYLWDEFGLYSYPEYARDVEHAEYVKPIKMHDHGMNGLEYCVEDLPVFDRSPQKGMIDMRQELNAA